MCIRDRTGIIHRFGRLRRLAKGGAAQYAPSDGPDHHAAVCLLYTSDAADERSSVDLGGRRIIKKKKSILNRGMTKNNILNKTTRRETKNRQ